MAPLVTRKDWEVAIGQQPVTSTSSMEALSTASSPSPSPIPGRTPYLLPPQLHDSRSGSSSTKATPLFPKGDRPNHNQIGFPAGADNTERATAPLATDTQNASSLISQSRHRRSHTSKEASPQIVVPDSDLKAEADLHQQQKQRKVDDSDNRSVSSNRSTRSWWTLRGGGQSSKTSRNVVVESKRAQKSSRTLKTSTLKNVNGTNETNVQNPKKPKFFLSIQSLRWRKAKTGNTRRAGLDHDQMVADFFEVKSISSAPDLIGDKRLTFFTARAAQGVDAALDTQSVCSHLHHHHSTRAFSTSWHARQTSGATDADTASIGLDAQPTGLVLKLKTDTTTGRPHSRQGSLVGDDEDITLASGLLTATSIRSSGTYCEEDDHGPVTTSGAAPMSVVIRKSIKTAGSTGVSKRSPPPPQPTAVRSRREQLRQDEEGQPELPSPPLQLPQYQQNDRQEHKKTSFLRKLFRWNRQQHMAPNVMDHFLGTTSTTVGGGGGGAATNNDMAAAYHHSAAVSTRTSTGIDVTEAESSQHSVSSDVLGGFYDANDASSISTYYSGTGIGADDDQIHDDKDDISRKSKDQDYDEGVEVELEHIHQQSQTQRQFSKGITLPSSSLAERPLSTQKRSVWSPNGPMSWQVPSLRDSTTAKTDGQTTKHISSNNKTTAISTGVPAKQRYQPPLPPAALITTVVPTTPSRGKVSTTPTSLSLSTITSPTTTASTSSPTPKSSVKLGPTSRSCNNEKVTGEIAKSMVRQSPVGSTPRLSSPMIKNATERIPEAGPYPSKEGEEKSTDQEDEVIGPMKNNRKVCIRPTGQNASFDSVQVTITETSIKNRSDMKRPQPNLMKLVENEMLADLNDVDGDDDDDDSIISLLSGILASWEAERQGMPSASGIRVAARRQDRSESRISRSNDFEAVMTKSCLKNPCSSSPNGEQNTAVSSVPASPSTSPRAQFSVGFDRVQIREYERAVGDNPACTAGPPISIGWSYEVASDVALEDYEATRTPRRTKREFHLNPAMRTNMLTEEWGCSEEDIRKARREATYIQYCREKTAFSGAQGLDKKEAAFLRKANRLNRKNDPLAAANGVGARAIAALRSNNIRGTSLRGNDLTSKGTGTTGTCSSIPSPSEVNDDEERALIQKLEEILAKDAILAA